MAQGFDVDRATLTGQMVPIAEEVGITLNRGNGAFSLSETGALAFSGGGTGTREVTWRDRAGKPLAVVAPPDRTYTTVSLSPDENSVAFGIFKDGGESSDLWVSDSAGGMRDRVTSRNALSSDPVWSPDGKRIVFTDNFALYVRPIKVLRPKRSYPGGTNIRALDWSRDGKRLLYQVQLGQGTATDLGVLNLEEGRKATVYFSPGPVKRRVNFPRTDAGLRMPQMSQGDLKFTYSDSLRMEIDDLCRPPAVTNRVGRMTALNSSTLLRIKS